MGYTSTDHQLQQDGDPPPDQITAASSSWFEVLCGVLGLAIAIVGIVGDHPWLMGATATLLLGLGVFAQAGTIAARANRCSERDELLGISADLVAGLVGIALGALVLLHVVQFTWLPLATMALGCGLMFAARVDLGKATPSLDTWSQVVILAAGLAAMALALFAFAGVALPTTVALLAIACVGGGLALAGGGSPTMHRAAGSRREPLDSRDLDHAARAEGTGGPVRERDGRVALESALEFELDTIS